MRRINSVFRNLMADEEDIDYDEYDDGYEDGYDDQYGEKF